MTHATGPSMGMHLIPLYDAIVLVGFPECVCVCVAKSVTADGPGVTNLGRFKCLSSSSPKDCSQVASGAVGVAVVPGSSSMGDWRWRVKEF